ncbi:MAG: hypothetical protein IJR38_04335 [Selenomonadaceae bacterium]|nr:hypothetical protein [Selenomonadaceae bacterium]
MEWVILAHSDGTEDKRVTDSSFVITRADKTKKRYHIECEEQLNGAILVRIFEYDAQIALDDHTIDGAELTVSFSHSAVMALRYAEKSPDTMKIKQNIEFSLLASHDNRLFNAHIAVIFSKMLLNTSSI